MPEAVASPISGLRLDGASATDTGRVRDSNEDRAFVDLEHGIFLVVDGVGGHAAGEVAAALAVEVIAQRLARRTATVEQRVREAIVLANNEIFRQAQRSPLHAGMTCVLTLAVVTDAVVTIGHVGDSRLYKIGPRGLVKITHDHSPVGEREDAGELTEVEAMRHPRRNEVFRDVGSALREPDAEDFIEVIETTFEPEAALLLCSDGLADMLPSTVIERVVRAHAGDAAATAQALVDQANEAGGKDNVTVVYVEGPDFATALRQHRASAANDVATIELGRPPNTRPGSPMAEFESTVTSTDESRSSRIRQGSGGQTALHGVLSRRSAWLGAGMLIGLAIAFGLSIVPPFDRYLSGARSRTLVVGANALDRYSTITAALADAAPGDVVQVEPGEYLERIVLFDGVDLVARAPGSVTLAAPSGAQGWTAVSVNGAGSRVRGIRVVGRPNAPLTTGIRLAGHDALVDDVTIEGAVAVGMDVVADGSLVIRSSRFERVDGLPLRVGAATRPEIRQNLFVNRSATDQGAVAVAADAVPTVVGNLFVGYSIPIVGASALTDRLRADNYFLREGDRER